MTDQIHYIGRNHFKVMTTNAPNHVTFCSVASPNAGYTHSPHCNACLKYTASRTVPRSYQPSLQAAHYSCANYAMPQKPIVGGSTPNA